MKIRPTLVALLTLTLLGSFALAQDVPRLKQQTPDGETDPLCCAVAVSGFVPFVYVGKPIPITPGSGNYVGVQAMSVPDYETVRVLLDKPGQHREVYGTAYPMPGWPENWTFGRSSGAGGDHLCCQTVHSFGQSGCEPVLNFLRVRGRLWSIKYDSLRHSRTML